MEGLKTYTVDELKALYSAVAGELQRRDTLEKAAADLDAAVDDYTAAVGGDRPAGEGEPWRQPTGVHDAYRLGATVTHGGAQWVSLIDWNVWAPGVSGWRLVETDGPAALVQPTGAHDAYKKGDKVAFDGQVFESLIDGNMWSSTGYAAGWRETTD